MTDIDQLSIPKVMCSRNTKYHIMHSIGQGSSGYVFTAIEETNGVKKVRAVKVVSHKKTPTDRIKNETILHQRCFFHPNVMKLNEVFEIPNYTCFVMPRMSYSMEKLGIVEELCVRNLFRQMVDAVAHVHLNKIIHHDVKLHNFIVDEKNFVYLSDFGLSRYMGTDIVCTETLGTPKFVAPEIVADVFRNEKNKIPLGHSYSVDIWSLGVCLYLLVSGRYPFLPSVNEKYCGKDENYRLYKSISEEDMHPIKCSSNLSCLIGALLQKDPADRITIPEILKHPFLSI